jgi:hypothetical protein
VRVTTSELRRVLEVLLVHLESTSQSEFEVQEDFYWAVPAGASYDAYEQPTELTIGQLSDDWTRLQAIGEGKAEPLGYALVWASTVIRAIGEKAR